LEWAAAVKSVGIQQQLSA